jgi:hypothetical protein
MRYLSMAALTVCAALAGATCARAADTDAFAKRLFAGKIASAGKSYACFMRRYDAAHLATHGQQKVKAMKLLVTAEIVPEDKQLNYSFQLGLEFRDRLGKFNTSGSCGHPSVLEESADKLHLGCGVDCDGGGISIEMANADKSTLVRVEQVAIWDNSNPDAERTGFDGGADDHLFRLDRVDLEQCRPLITADESLAAM